MFKCVYKLFIHQAALFLMCVKCNVNTITRWLLIHKIPNCSTDQIRHILKLLNQVSLQSQNVRKEADQPEFRLLHSKIETTDLV